MMWKKSVNIHETDTHPEGFAWKETLSFPLPQHMASNLPLNAASILLEML